MKTEYAPFDIASHLDSDEMIAGYLTAAAEDDDPNVLLGAIAHVAKARGMKQVAEAAGLGRESLYKALAPGAHPRFQTVQAVLRALNVSLTVQEVGGRKAAAKQTAIAKAAKAKREATWAKFHAAGAGFRAHGSQGFAGAKKSAAKRSARKTAAKRTPR
jgi:probable addiction module antidote protein